MNTTERRFRLIQLLLFRRYETMANLAFELGVSTKTIQRDLLEINTLIPIYCKTGRHHGGVYLIEGYSVPKTYMSAEEIQLLMKIKDYISLSDSFTENDVTILEMIIEKYSIPCN